MASLTYQCPKCSQPCQKDMGSNGKDSGGTVHNQCRSCKVMHALDYDKGPVLKKIRVT